MKKMISLISFCATLATASAQTPDAGLLIRKSGQQKTIAWILAGGGVGLITTGFLVGVSWANDLGNGSLNTGSKLTTGGLLVATGGTAVLGSIPFFIASGKNKRKANLLLKNENVFYQQFNSKQRLLSLAVKINL